MKKVVNFDWFKIDGKWRYCQWISDDGKMKQYVDGELISEQSLKD